MSTTHSAPVVNGRFVLFGFPVTRELANEVYLEHCPPELRLDDGKPWPDAWGYPGIVQVDVDLSAVPGWAGRPFLVAGPFLIARMREDDVRRDLAYAESRGKRGEIDYGDPDDPGGPIDVAWYLTRPPGYDAEHAAEFTLLQVPPTAGATTMVAVSNVIAQERAWFGRLRFACCGRDPDPVHPAEMRAVVRVPAPAPRDEGQRHPGGKPRAVTAEEWERFTAANKRALIRDPAHRLYLPHSDIAQRLGCSVATVRRLRGAAPRS